MPSRRWARIQLAVVATVLALVPPVPGATPPLLVQAAREARQGHWEEVIALLQPVADRDGRAALLLGYAFLQRGHPAEATKALATAARLHSSLGDLARFYEGEAWIAQGNFAEAIQRYHTVIATSPCKRIVARALLQQGEAFLRAGQPGNAVTSLKRALQAGEGSKDRVLFLLGQAYEALGQPQEALGAYVYVWRAFPGSPFEFLAGERVRALEARTGLRATIPAEVRFLRAIGFLRRGALRMSEKAFLAVLDSSPPLSVLSESLYRLGQVRLSLGDLQGAARAFARGAAIQGRWRDASRYWQGVALLRAGQERAARRVFRSLAQRSSAGTWAGRALLQLASLELSAGRWREADRALEQVTRQFTGALQWEGLWRRGWLRVGRGRDREAEGFFLKLASVSPPAHASRALFWVAYLEGRRGASRQARERLEYLATTYPLTYYGQQARFLLGLPLIQFPQKGDNLLLRRDSRALGRVVALTELGLVQEAISEAREVAESTQLGLAERTLLARILQDLGEYHAGIALVEEMLDWSWEKGVQPGRDLWELAYPLGFWDHVREAANRFGLDPLLVLAVIREESRFNPQAISPAGARGLMQVMPSTGERIAKQISDFQKPRSQMDLTDPETNILLGTAYLGHLLKRFDGNVALAIAGYNAGPGAVSQWRDQLAISDLGFRISNVEGLKSAFRNPQSEMRNFNWFVETIPYRETREYLKRVLQSYGIYQALWPLEGKR
ncbi:MAG: transglycosylase SLT domain-containing protein [Armatimonadota bacterium]|nr:transglycosylase SLT domain-containing protein [Armatimonadota bacterium]